MAMRSFPSVKITYFDKQAVWEALREYLEQVERGRPEVEKVILFGSFLRGESVPGSDIDLLIILRESSIPFLERIPEYTPLHFPIGADVFPYTEQELEEMKQQGNFFLRKVLEEGIEVFPSNNMARRR